MDYEKLAEEFEKAENTCNEVVEQPQNTDLIANNTENSSFTATTVVQATQERILESAKKRISDNKIVEKHADKLAAIADEAIAADSEAVELGVKRKRAQNKAERQRIKNELIVLKAEAKRLKKEQEQLNKEQKIDHSKRNAEAKWKKYGEKLKKMHYDYVPNAVTLAMLLFFDSIRSFVDGLGTISTAIVKAAKWIILLGVIFGIVYAIPFTREILLNILNGGTN